jgi:CHAT domain-containing protein
LSARLYDFRLSRAVARTRAIITTPGFQHATLFERDDRHGAAHQLSELARRATGDRAARAHAIAQFAAGDCSAAVSTFESILQRNATDWSDLAAAQICLARTADDADRWLAALAAADRALAIDRYHAEAQFNRAVVLDALGARQRARTQKLKYLALGADSARAAIVRENLVRLPPPDTAAWHAAAADLNAVSSERLVSLTRTYPEPARRYAEALYLPVWASRVKQGDHAAARSYLEKIRIIAQTLQRETGESLLTDTVRNIDSQAVPPAALLDGLIAYLEGRKALNADPALAEQQLLKAEALFAKANCPLEKMAEHYRAMILSNEYRMSEALDIFYRRIAAERAAGASHKALFAQTQYQIALIEAVRGSWSASLAAANESLELFSAIRERENAGAVYAVISEDYDLIGQRELALNQGMAGLRATLAVGDFDRARVMLATLCRTELRAGEAERAFSLTSLEWEIAPFTTDHRHDPDMFLRRATAQWQMGELAGARRSIGEAKKAANVFADSATRAKLLADIDAAEATFMRRRDPRRAIALLSSAIDFQHKAARPIVLPELYLERGRAHLAIDDAAAAERDFEAGLAELERQRSRVSEAELRPGIFDDASGLFDEAIALQLRRGADADAVLRQVERGRARAVLEQINAGDDPVVVTPMLPRIADIQRDLNAGTAVLEYVSLPDRLVVFVITSDRAVIRTIPIKRDALIEAARAFTSRRGADGSAMYDVLLAPLDEDLHGVSAINVIADDFLQRLPLAALFDRRTRTFAVERYAIATSPSAGVFLATRARTKRLPARPSGTALVFANPTIPIAEFGELPSLLASEYEAPRVARRYSRSEVLTGDDATAERFRELAPSHEFIHFGGHGVIKEREPFSSALVCAATPRRAGALTAREIARMNFRSTRGVVLAACSTMTGRNAAIEGVPSLARAFLIAGVPAVVGTLWDIEDGQAASITLPLHEQFARGVAPAEALRIAQIAAIRRRLPPSQWSAFALMGAAGR